MMKDFLKKFSVLSMTILLMVSALACSPKPVVENKQDLAENAYCAKLGDSAASYFMELAEKATGITPEETGLGFRNASLEFLEADVLPLEEILKNGNPVLRVSLGCETGRHWSDEEIHAIIKETVERGIIVDYAFDFNDYRLYQVGTDGVQIDVTTPKDGGAMHQLEDYEL